MNSIFTLFLATVALLTAACTTVSETALKVQVHTQISSVLDQCKRLGPVSAYHSSMILDSREALSVKLREASAALGGDTVVLLNIDETLTEARQQGIAYRCY